LSAVQSENIVLKFEEKMTNFSWVKNNLTFVSCEINVLPLGKLIPLLLKLNDQYLNITGKSPIGRPSFAL
jgi:hypothetical protein